MTNRLFPEIRSMVRHKELVLWIVLLLLCGLHGSLRSETDPWAGYRGLLGEWIAEQSPGQATGAGSFAFSFDLQERIIVRKNHLAIAGGRVHDDLLVLYLEDSTGVKAIYFDNEGHIIHYRAEVSGDGQSIVFLSDPAAGSPRFKLTYRHLGGDRLEIAFLIAAPGSPDSFTPYLRGSARRK
jgi:hypothetical protein